MMIRRDGEIYIRLSVFSLSSASLSHGDNATPCPALPRREQQTGLGLGRRGEEEMTRDYRGGDGG